jgi:hypothetical protein
VIRLSGFIHASLPSTNSRYRCGRYQIQCHEQTFPKKRTLYSQSHKKYFVPMLLTKPQHSWQHQLPHKFQSHTNHSQPSRIHSATGNTHNMPGHRYEIQLRSHQSPEMSTAQMSCTSELLDSKCGHYC